MRWWIVGSLTLAAAGSASAGAPGQAAGSRSPTQAAAQASNTLESVAHALRAELLQRLPEPLYEHGRQWGHTASTLTGIKFSGRGLHVRTRTTHGPRNQGTWQKLRLTLVQPAQTLRLQLTAPEVVEPGRVRFNVFLSAMVRAEYEQQNWQAGVRLYSGTAQARGNVRLQLGCEVTMRLEAGTAFLPDAVLTVRIVNSNVAIDQLVVEHIAGVGGDAARLLGDAALAAVRRRHPSLERNLLRRAEEAITRTCQGREVRLGLQTLLRPSSKSAASAVLAPSSSSGLK